ncbi:MAG: IS30 family transposase [Lachnospiraceae bacterium]|nr:IS30 family transposase [Lachnospiraceae bacterium]
MSKFKHLTYKQRVIIEDRLSQRCSIRYIANELEKSPSTISREIQKNVEVTVSKDNDCAHRKGCPNKNRCTKEGCNSLCAECKIVSCKKYCPDYVPIKCKRLSKPPYVCNGCPQRGHCQHRRVLYNSHKAQTDYNKNLKERRQGYDITTGQLKTINELASPMIKNGCSPYHIKQTYGDKIPVSEATLRRMIHGNVLDARDIDLREVVKRKERKRTRNKDRLARIHVSKIDHLYSDYLDYIKEHGVHTVEMDCVEGKKDEKATLLTLHFKEAFLQIAIIMEEQNSEEVVKALNKLEEIIGADLFKEMFPLILTDNGQEFTDIKGMERSVYGGTRTKIFFCEPNRSDEKGSCENHHKMIRYAIPKGTSLEQFNQTDINLLMNHINSYSRKELHGLSAYKVAKMMFPSDFFELLGIEEIPPEDINLTPRLFKNA